MKLCSWLVILSTLWISFCLEDYVFAQDAVIQSIGEYANEEFEWAFGVPEVDFYGVCNCSSFFWFIDNTVVCNVNKGIAATDPCVVTNFNGFNNCTCNYDGFQDRMSSNLTRGNVDSSFSLSLTSDFAGSNTLVNRSATFKYCNNETGVSDENIDVSSITKGYIFEESVVVKCSTSAAITVTLTCDSDATWRKTGSCPRKTTTVAAPTTTIGKGTSTLATLTTIIIETTTTTTTTTEGTGGLDGGIIAAIVIVIVVVICVGGGLSYYYKDKICPG